MKTTHRLLVALAAVAVCVLCAALGYPLAGLGSGLLIIGAVGSQAESDVCRQLAAWRILDAMGGPLKRIVVKTADYTVLSPLTAAGGDASGTIFTTRGAVGTVIFTLPAPTGALAGVYYDFLSLAAQTVTLATATADTLIAANDLTADSLGIATAGQKIGAMMRAICDGTSWIAMGMTPGLGADTTTTTYTVTT